MTLQRLTRRPELLFVLALIVVVALLPDGLPVGIAGLGVVTGCVLGLHAMGIALPALYVLNSLSGSQLRQSTTLLAALVTTSWGGLAMIASIPINWFFTAALPGIVPPGWVPRLVQLVNLVVFTGVGVSMSDVFGRVMQALEPSRGRRPLWWLAVVGAIGAELFYAFGLFQFTLPS